MRKNRKPSGAALHLDHALFQDGCMILRLQAFRKHYTSFWVKNTCDTWSVSSHCSINKSNKSSTTSLCNVVKSQVLTPPICPSPSQDGTNTATPFPCRLKTHLLRTSLTSPAPPSLPFLAYPTATSNICFCLTMIVLKHSSSSFFELLFGWQAFLYYNSVCLDLQSGHHQPEPQLILLLTSS